MSLVKTRKEARGCAIEAGRQSLRAQLDKARERGVIYYHVSSVSKSGMSRRIHLAYVDRDGSLERIWPSAPGLDMDAESKLGGYSAALDIIARDWGFRFDKDPCGFMIGGCGMDMVFALVDNLAYLAYGRAGDRFANDVRQEAMI